MPITLTLVDDRTRGQAIRAIERATPRTRITISDPALTDGQLILLRVLTVDVMANTPDIELPMRQWELSLTAAMWGDQGMEGFEPGTVVVKGVPFEELSVSQGSEMAEFIRMYGAKKGVIFREPK
jgi:NinB protein